MADTTEISWTDRTWNPWWGCSEIAPECGQHAPTGGHGLCYAAVFASRGLQAQHTGIAHTGKWTGVITRSTPAVWAAPFRWPAGSLVFTCSMSDFWHEDVPLAMLDEALDVIDRTPSLVYQILSKRPGNAQRRLDALKRRLPSNVWVGATIGHERSLPLLKPLRRLEATLRFLSCEPLLTALPGLTLGGIGWVIAGGQSGRDATPMHPNWVRDLRDECAAAAIPFHFKQWGEWIPGQQLGIDGCSSPTVGGRGIMLKGESALFEGREFDVCALDAGARNLTFRVGKHRSGALLDGREWREFPMTPSDSAGA